MEAGTFAKVIGKMANIILDYVPCKIEIVLQTTIVWPKISADAACMKVSQKKHKKLTSSRSV